MSSHESDSARGIVRNRRGDIRAEAGPITNARRMALVAVRDGLVVINVVGQPTYPQSVSGTALTAAYRAGLWRWPGPHHPRAGDVALLTSRGEDALR